MGNCESIESHYYICHGCSESYVDGRHLTKCAFCEHSTYFSEVDRLGALDYKTRLMDKTMNNKQFKNRLERHRKIIKQVKYISRLVGNPSWVRSFNAEVRRTNGKEESEEEEEDKDDYEGIEPYLATLNKYLQEDSMFRNLAIESTFDYSRGDHEYELYIWRKKIVARYRDIYKRRQPFMKMFD